MGKLLGGVAAAVYAGSFLLPVLGESFRGYHAFMVALAVFPLFLPLWLANPAFWVGLYCLLAGRRRGAGTAAGMAVALSLSEAWMFWGSASLGYYLWQASLVLLAVAACCAPAGESPRLPDGGKHPEETPRPAAG
jgi:hypothetical protein